MITFSQRGNFNNTERTLRLIKERNYRNVLERYAQQGVAALSAATPVKTGKTAESWDYEITDKGSEISIVWTNSNLSDNVNVAIILQYGHATKNGGYVEGIDYINPALASVFRDMADSAWREVTR